jgi:hypothetical protein
VCVYVPPDVGRRRSDGDTDRRGVSDPLAAGETARCGSEGLPPRLPFEGAIWRRLRTPPPARSSRLQVRRDEALLRILQLLTP